MSNYILRSLEESDFEAVWEIWREGNREVAESEPLLPFDEGFFSRGSFRTTQESDTGEGHHQLVAEAEGAVVGWGHAYVTHTPEGTLIGYVSSVYVARPARARGIGSALLNALTEWLGEQEVTRIELVAASRSPARALWTRLGFRPFMETLVFEGGSVATERKQ